MNSPASMVRKTLRTTILKATAPRAFEFVISSDAVDRDHDTIAVAGWRLDEFRANPVVMFAHRLDEPPIARANDVSVVAGALRATVEFPEPGTYDKADVIRRLIEQDFLRATSVGFRPEKWVVNERRGGYDFQEQTLYEVSVVPVPSNASALLVGPAKGVNLTALNRFLRSPRESTVNLDVTAAEVRAAFRSPEIRSWITEEAARRVKWAATRDDEHVITLDDEPEDVLRGLSKADVGAALRETLPAMVGDAVTRAVNLARGRVD